MAVHIKTTLLGLPEPYVRELTAAGEQNFFLGLRWFQNFERTALEKDSTLRLYAVEDNQGEPRIMLVMRTPASAMGSIFRGRLHGSKTLSGFTNFQSCEYGPVISTRADIHSDLRHLATALASEKPAWQVIEINSLDPTNPFFPAAVQAFRAAGFAVCVRQHFGNWFERFTGLSYAEHMKRTDSSTKKQFQNYGRKGRKLEKDGKVEYALYTDESQIDRALKDFQLIVDASWRTPERSKECLLGTLQAAASDGKLRMGVLYFNGKPVATEIGVLFGKRATMISTAYDESLREYSVGALVMIRVLEHLVDVDRVEEIDFGRDDQDYKKLWLSQRRERWAIVAFNLRTLTGFRYWSMLSLHNAYESVLTKLKPIVKPLLQRFKKIQLYQRASVKRGQIFTR